MTTFTKATIAKRNHAAMLAGLAQAITEHAHEVHFGLKREDTARVEKGLADLELDLAAFKASFFGESK